MSPSAHHDFYRRRKGIALRQLVGGAFVVGALFLAWWSQKPPTKPQRLVLRGLAFSTVYQVSIVSDAFPKDAQNRVRSIINRETDFVDALMSRYRKDSELAELTRHRSDGPLKLSAPLVKLLAVALEVSRLTGGAFDITVGPLTGLWGFDQNKERTKLPADGDIAAALGHTGYKNLEINSADNSAIKRIPELDLDLSAIAKGYAVDRIAEALEKAGFGDYLVEIGGEVRGKGKNDKGVYWRVGIEKPISERRETFQVIELNNRSVATSGDYRNFYLLDGQRFSHTIDPRNGRPVSHGLASVTVVHQSCAMADALATGFTVLGPDEGIKLAEKMGLPALFITREKDDKLVDRATSAFPPLAMSRKNSTVKRVEGEDR